MRISQHDASEERRKMIHAADLHYEVMEGMSDDEVGAYVKTVIDAATIVFATYPDAGSLDGVGMYIIKGKRELASSRSDQFPATAIPCLELELAIAAEKMFGDGARGGDH
jgi:hypothetical protein